ncbi:MAG: polymer-forming cytoskeletal protein [Aliivibrio sp.]|uniref:bactofilin family protein n=1 Tax=Aliivibrio sp. TaxID=1872443 RepID=UPI001A442EEC|nr:polymer-forming cytoskeletal protein [Aliivibrio sp.]
MGMFNNSGSSTTSTTLSIIAKGCRITGEIESEQNIQIDGYFEGSIKTEQQVFITPSGRVKGSINAKLVIINGLVEGTCISPEVNIQSKGQFRGILETKQLIIEKGGLLIGENREAISSEELKLVTKSKQKPAQKPEVKSA